MKKLSTLIASTLCLVAVAACAKPEASSSSVGEVESSSLQEAKKYKLNVTGIGVTLKVSPDLPKEGEYEEGNKFSFKVKIIQDHQYVPYLNDVALEPFKSDSIVDGFNYYSFDMPAYDCTLNITDDPFFLDKSYSFSDIFTWVLEITEDSLKGVEIETGYVGVDKETNPPTIRYSEEQEDLAYNLDVLKTEKVVRLAGAELPEGGSYRTVTYKVKSGSSYSFTIQNGYILNSKDSVVSMFKFESNSPKYPDIMTKK